MFEVFLLCFDLSHLSVSFLLPLDLGFGRVVFGIPEYVVL